MTDGRTLWWSKDAAWYDREYIVLLGKEFGAEGTTVIDVLSCMAKFENNAGYVKTGYVSLSRKANISDEDTTRRIVARAVEHGALDDFSEDRLTFTVRVSGWKSDQEHARAAVKQAAYRDRQAKTGSVPGGDPAPSETGKDSSPGVAAPPNHETGNVVIDDAPPPVTTGNGSSPTEQNRTEVTTSLRSVVVESDRLDQAATTLKNGVIRDLFAYWQQECKHPKAKLTPERQKAMQARIKQDYTAEQIREGINGAARNPPVDRDSGVVYDDLTSICRNGAQLERYIARAGKPRGVDDDSPAALAARFKARSAR